MEQIDNQSQSCCGDSCKSSPGNLPFQNENHPIIECYVEDCGYNQPNHCQLWIAIIPDKDTKIVLPSQNQGKDKQDTHIVNCIWKCLLISTKKAGQFFHIPITNDGNNDNQNGEEAE